MVQCEECKKDVRRRKTYHDRKLCKKCADKASMSEYLALSAFILSRTTKTKEHKSEDQM